MGVHALRLNNSVSSSFSHPTALYLQYRCELFFIVFQAFQQIYFYVLGLEMGGGFPNMGINPFLMQGNGSTLLSQLLNQSGLHPGWAGALANKAFPHMWMNEDSKV